MTRRYMPHMFFHIVAVCDNNVIGYNGSLPWKLRYDVRWYRTIVKNHAMIVGCRSYEAAKSIFDKQRVYVIDDRRLSIREALTNSQDEEKVFIMGGASIFRQTIDVIRGIWVMRIHVAAKGDLFYPEIPKDMKCTYSYIQAEDKCHGQPKVGLHYYERKWEYERS